MCMQALGNRSKSIEFTSSFEHSTKNWKRRRPTACTRTQASVAAGRFLSCPACHHGARIPARSLRNQKRTCNSIRMHGQDASWSQGAWRTGAAVCNGTSQATLPSGREARSVCKEIQYTVQITIQNINLHCDGCEIAQAGLSTGLRRRPRLCMQAPS